MQIDKPFIQPMLPAADLEASLRFYRALGCEVVTHTSFPYDYAEIQFGDLWLHFSGLAVYGGKRAFGACMVTIANLIECHDEFADGLRDEFGVVPVRGLPRVTRPRENQTRFSTFDPDGNMLVFLKEEAAHLTYSDASTPLAQAREHAEFLRDIYANDVAASCILDRAIRAGDSTDRIEFARCLGVRMEIAVALDEVDQVAKLRVAIAQLHLKESERRETASYLEAAEHLRAWITGHSPKRTTQSVALGLPAALYGPNAQAEQSKHSGQTKF